MVMVRTHVKIDPKSSKCLEDPLKLGYLEEKSIESIKIPPLMWSVTCMTNNTKKNHWKLFLQHKKEVHEKNSSFSTIDPTT